MAKKKKKGFPFGWVAVLGATAAAALILIFKEAEAVPEEPEEGMARLYGKVTDSESGAGISGARVTTTGAITETDSNGRYATIDIPPGTWAVEFKKDGYETKRFDFDIREGNNELNVELVPTGAETPPEEPGGNVEIESITLNKETLLPGEDFNITITFKNPNNYDIYVRPRFAFGKVNGDNFSAENVLAGMSYYGEEGMLMDPKESFDWVNMGRFPGTDMEQGVIDPDGIGVIPPGDGTGEYWLRVPTGGTATTSMTWTVTVKDFEAGLKDICVEIPNPYYLVYDEAWSQRLVGGEVYTLNWRPVVLSQFAGVVEEAVYAGLAPDAVTIDALEAKITGRTASTKVTLTNNTGETLKNEPGKRIYTRLQIAGYSGEDFSYDYLDPGRTKPTLHSISVRQQIFWMLDQTGTTGIGDIAPGTSILEDSYTMREMVFGVAENMPKPLNGFVIVRFYQIDERPTPQVYGADVWKVFKGSFSGDWQTWEEIPAEVGKFVSGGSTGYEYYYPVTLLDGSGLRLKF